LNKFNDQHKVLEITAKLWILQVVHTFLRKDGKKIRIPISQYPYYQLFIIFGS